MCRVITRVWRAAGCEWAHNDPHRKCERLYWEVFNATKDGHRHHVVSTASLIDTQVRQSSLKYSGWTLGYCTHTHKNIKREQPQWIETQQGSTNAKKKKKKRAEAFKEKEFDRNGPGLINRVLEPGSEPASEMLYASLLLFFGFVNITALCCLDSELITMTVISVKSNRKLWIYVN